MPSTLNGLGTSLVRASRKRNVQGHVQFDAIEAFVFAFCPLVPYKVLHVLSIWSEGIVSKQYQSIPLRFSGRLVAKGILNGWGNVLMILGGLGAAIACFDFSLRALPLNHSDLLFLIVVCTLFVLGVVLKLLYLAMDGTDERIKNIIGTHDQGTSDPYYWSDEALRMTTDAIMASQGQQPLIDLAEESFHGNNTATAMYITRIGMRVAPSPRFQELFERLKSETLRVPRASA